MLCYVIKNIHCASYIMTIKNFWSSKIDLSKFFLKVVVIYYIIFNIHSHDKLIFYLTLYHNYDINVLCSDWKNKYLIYMMIDNIFISFNLF